MQSLRSPWSLGFLFVVGATAACGSADASDAGLDGSRLDAGDTAPPDATSADADAGPVDETADPDAVYDAYSEEMCDLARRCAAISPLGYSMQFFCHPGYEDLIWGIVLSAWRSGNASYDPALGQACLDAIRAIDDCPQPFVLPPDECIEMVTGTVAAGGACSGGPISRECLSDLHCVTEDACPGRCESYSAEGEACSGARYCEIELECVDGTCVRPAAEGESCIDLPCERFDLCVSGSCTSLRGVGESCSADTLCETGLPCIDGVCGEYPGTEEGAPCEQTIGCPYPLACVGTGSGHTCVRGVARGEACDESTPCSPGDRCDGGVCLELVDTGAQCGATRVCPEGQDCIEGNCLPQPVAGESCATRDCFESRCETDGICASIVPSGCQHRVATCPFGYHCALVDGTSSCRENCL